jgi:hypothetical protein
VTSEELASLLGVEQRQLRRWNEAGCPVRQGLGGDEWEEAAVRGWLIEQARQGRKQAATRALASTGDAVSVELADRIARVRTPRDLVEASRDVASEIAQGRVSPARASVLLKAIGEARHGLALIGPQATEGDLFCTAEAVRIVDVFEQIVNGRRRKAVLAFVEEQARLDRLDFPQAIQVQPDAMRAKLEELGLDAWGEPVVD